MLDRLITPIERALHQIIPGNLFLPVVTLLFLLVAFQFFREVQAIRRSGGGVWTAIVIGATVYALYWASTH